MPSCSQPSRTLRALKAWPETAILDRHARDGTDCAQVGTWRNRGTGNVLALQRQWSGTMSKSNQYVGLDVSLKETFDLCHRRCGKIVWRGRVDSTPEAIATAVKQPSPMRSDRARKWAVIELAVPRVEGAGLPLSRRCAPRQGGAVAEGQQDDATTLRLAQIMRAAGRE